MARSIIIVTPGPEAWGNFKKLCKAKGWVYQTLNNQRRIPSFKKAIEIDGLTITKVELH